MPLLLEPRSAPAPTLTEVAERQRLSQAAVESARVYLESVLANLSTGVLAFAPDGTLRAANQGAMAILGDDLAGFESIPLAQWPRHLAFRDTLLAQFAAHPGDWHTQVDIPVKDSPPLTLLIHGSRLPEHSEGGLVVVFDDISRPQDDPRGGERQLYERVPFVQRGTM